MKEKDERPLTDKTGGKIYCRNCDAEYAYVRSLENKPVCGIECAIEIDEKINNRRPLNEFEEE